MFGKYETYQEVEVDGEHYSVLLEIDLDTGEWSVAEYPDLDEEELSNQKVDKVNGFTGSRLDWVKSGIAHQINRVIEDIFLRVHGSRYDSLDYEPR